MTDPRPTADALTPAESVGPPDTVSTGPYPAADADPRFGPPAKPTEIGTLGRYRILAALGKGGMGAVYLAFDPRLGRRVAVKVMLPRHAADPDARARFLREARAAARIDHPHVVSVYDVDEADGVPYIAMPYLKGCPLSDYLREKGTLSVSQAVRMAGEVARGLAAAHEAGLIHRDVKPANVWLEAPDGRAKLLDFGLARPPAGDDPQLTQEGAMIGTPAYMAPEQARGWKLDHRADLFSLGVVLYRLVTGKPPFPGATTTEVITAVVADAPVPVRSHNPDVPEALAALIHQLLEKNPDDRPATASEVADRLADLDRPPPGEPAVVYVPVMVVAAESAFADLDAGPTVTGPPRPSPRGPWLLVGGMLLAAVVAGVGSVALVGKRKATAESTWSVEPRAVQPQIAASPPTAAPPAIVAQPPLPAVDDSAIARELHAGGCLVKLDDGTDRHLLVRIQEPFPDRPVKLWGVTTSSTSRLRPHTVINRLSSDPARERIVALHFPDHAMAAVYLSRLTLFPMLETLDLSRSALTDVGVGKLPRKKLVSLYLSGNPQVTDASIPALTEMTSLRTVDVSFTAMTLAGIVKLRAECPRLRVETDLKPADNPPP